VRGYFRISTIDRLRRRAAVLGLPDPHLAHGIPPTELSTGRAWVPIWYPVLGPSVLLDRSAVGHVRLQRLRAQNRAPAGEKLPQERRHSSDRPVT